MSKGKKKAPQRTTAKKVNLSNKAQKAKKPTASVQSQNKQEEKETFPHFRKYRPSKHPALIVGEHSPEEYRYRKVMHGDRDGRHLNERIYPNPNPLDKEPMHIVRRVRHDKKDNFSKWKYPWKYPGKS